MMCGLAVNTPEGFESSMLRNVTTRATNTREEEKKNTMFTDLALSAVKRKPHSDRLGIKKHL